MVTIVAALLSLLLLVTNSYAADLSISLEPIIEIPDKFYPGQEGKLGYRISYLGVIKLTKEELPLLNPTGFTKIGDIEVKEYELEGREVQVLTQKIRSIEAGKYSIPQSTIEGIAYWPETPQQTKLVKSHTPALTLSVLPFPKEGMPPSFQGAISRQLFWKVSIDSPNTLHLGDTVKLNIEIFGFQQNDADTISFSNLMCQPGFPGFFHLLNSSSTLATMSKTYSLELEPLYLFINKIPQIEFSYFDPTASKYHILKNNVVDITISPITTQHPDAIPAPILHFPVPDTSWRASLLTPKRKG